MRKAPSFDSLLESAAALAGELRDEAAGCAAFIADFARNEAQSGDEEFLAENQRFQSAGAKRQALDGLLGELAADLDRLSDEVSEDLDSFRGLTQRERLTGWFSRQRMWRQHSQRVSEAPVVERLLDLFAKSDALSGLVSAHRGFAAECHKAAESGVVDIIEHRRRLVDAIDIARMRMKELNAKALTTQGRIGVYGGKADWERLEEERRALKAEAERISSEEQVMRDESHRRERFITMFQIFVDALNGQIALCNVLTRKLMVDTEERLVLYRAQVDTDRPGAKAKISQTIFPHIAAPISLFERGMLVPQDIEQRKNAADLAFEKKFSAFAPAVSIEHDTPLIDLTKKLPRLRLRFGRP